MNDYNLTIPLDIFRCCICSKIAYNPVNAKCDHVTCSICYDKIQGDKKCPLCREKLYNSFNNLIGKILKSTPFHHYQCSIEECEFEGTYKEILDHIKECPKKIIVCDKCKLPMTSEYYKKEHLKLLCNFRIIECEKCTKKIEAGDLNNHYQYECDYFEINCSKCNQKMLKKDLKQHDQMMHSIQVINCCLCNIDIKTNDYDFHLHSTHHCIRCYICQKVLEKKLYENHVENYHKTSINDKKHQILGITAYNSPPSILGNYTICSGIFNTTGINLTSNATGVSTINDEKITPIVSQTFRPIETHKKTFHKRKYTSYRPKK